MRILLILFLLSSPVFAGPYIGFAQGIHLQGEEINDSHPYIGFKAGNIGIIGYYNSFKKIGIAPYYEFSSGRVLKYSFKLGVTTGYNPIMSYGDHNYRLEKRFFFNDKLMLFAVPGISMVYEKVSIDLTLLGDSLNAGVTISW